MSGSASESGQRSLNLVLAEVARSPGISRSDVAKRMGVNLATVSRASRDLIDCGLVEETDIAARPEMRRPGRPFIGLRLRADGGVIIGIGINAFRQSVTLANIRNEKIAEWISPTPPDADGQAFVEICVDRAAEMLAKAEVAAERCFGVGMAVAADIDRARNVLNSAPTFGWTAPINVGGVVADRLGVPLAIETPSLAMTQAEADFGQAREARSVVTLHCSLGFGIGARRLDDSGHGSTDFGRVLTKAKTAAPSPVLLDGLCGGVSVLNRLHGEGSIKGLPDSARAQLLSDAVEDARSNQETARVFRDAGCNTGQFFALTLDVLSPDVLILAGPLAQSADFVSGASEAIGEMLAEAPALPDIRTTPMTPTGASRWLALRANVIHGDLDFQGLKRGLAA